MDKPLFPNRLKEWRTRRDLSLDRLAEMTGTTSSQISKLEQGKRRLTTDWMRRLANALQIRSKDLLPPSGGEAADPALRRVTVTGHVQAGEWLESHEWDESARRDVFVPDDPALEGTQLEAREVRGPSMDLTYPEGSVVVCRTALDGGVVSGKRYLIRRTRHDGRSEDTVKLVVQDEKGVWWLVPESSQAEFKAWTPVEDSTLAEVRALGQVVWSVRRER